jgi:hypothetical protein
MQGGIHPDFTGARLGLVEGRGGRGRERCLYRQQLASACGSTWSAAVQFDVPLGPWGLLYAAAHVPPASSRGAARHVPCSSRGTHNPAAAATCPFPRLAPPRPHAGETYLRILRAAKAGAPDIHVHAFSPLEVHQGATSLGLPYGGRRPAGALIACAAARA